MAIESLHPTIDFQRLEEISLASTSMVQAARDHMLAPNRVKPPPVLNATEICSITGIKRQNFNYHYSSNQSMPRGEINGNRREFTMADGREWIRYLRPDKVRNASLSTGCTIAVANYKGGVNKTTTTAVLAQGLCRRGMKVLVIDLDPQGSLSALHGILSDVDVDDTQTVMPLYMGVQKSIELAIQKSYWDGIDIVVASPALYSSEFILPARQRSEPGFEFWRVLDGGLDSVRDYYDVILIDTPPSLSYTTINALMAADGLIMPMPPSALDFASSAQFWNLCTDLIRTLYSDRGMPDKKFCFIDILLTKVDSAVGISAAVRSWIYTAYGSMVMPVEIPKSASAESASAQFGTVYDLAPGSVLAKTLKRSKDAYEAMVDYVENQVRGVWAGQVELNSKGEM